MHVAVIVAIVFGSIIIILTIVAMTGLAIIRLFKGGGKTRGLDDEEARTIQELYQGISRMEARVEALETLLLEKERKDK